MFAGAQHPHLFPRNLCHCMSDSDDVSDRGDVLSVEHFGASASGDVLLREYDFTVSSVCTRATALLARFTGAGNQRPNS
jgi:hypothetical protein